MAQSSGVKLINLGRICKKYFINTIILPAMPQNRNFVTPKCVAKSMPQNVIPLALDNRFEGLQTDDIPENTSQQSHETNPNPSNLTSRPVQDRNRVTGPHVNQKPEKDSLPEILQSRRDSTKINDSSNNNNKNKNSNTSNNNNSKNDNDNNRSSSNNNTNVTNNKNNNNINRSNTNSNNNRHSNNNNNNSRNWNNNNNNWRRKKKVGLIGDSNFNGINVPEINYFMRNVEVNKYSYSGATSLHLKHYCDILLEDQPQAVLIHVGTNDVWGRNRRDVPNEQIAKDIIDIGLKCKSKGVDDIYISSILITKVEDSNRRASEVNELLKLFCTEHNFSYINNDFITKDDLKDQVHLTTEGRYDLVDNYINTLEA